MSKFFKDLAERSAATFVQVFIAALLADWSGALNLGVVKAAGLAGLGAVLAVVKAAVAKQFGDPESAAFLK